MAQDKINLSNDIVFFKTHNAMCSVANYPFTNKDNTLGAIYIIRDPRDVLVSYAKHDDTSLDFSLKALILNLQNKYTIQYIIGHNEIEERKECPSFNVQEWLEQEKIDVV